MRRGAEVLTLGSIRTRTRAKHLTWAYVNSYAWVKRACVHVLVPIHVGVIVLCATCISTYTCRRKCVVRLCMYCMRHVEHK